MCLPRPSNYMSLHPHTFYRTLPSPPSPLLPGCIPTDHILSWTKHDRAPVAYQFPPLFFFESSKAMAAWTPALCIVSMLLSARSQQVRRKGLISNICHVAQTLKDPQPQSYTHRTRHILSSSFYTIQLPLI